MTGYQSKKAAAQDKLDNMEREALKLALEALESGVKTTANRISWTEYVTLLINDAITAIKQTLAQPAQTEQCNYPDCKCPTENPCLKGLAQPAQKRNFCQRCGKRTKDIHTCTPPQEKNGA